MARIISVHSYRGGTGKSNTCASLAVLLAQQGKRIAVVDSDIQSPGIHVLFGLDERTVRYSLNDYLWGKCDILQTAHDVTPAGVSGRIFLVPSSIKVGEITRIIREGYDPALLTDGFNALMEQARLDALVIDTHPGLNEETILSIAISDTLLIILRPDQQDFLGTAITVEVARKLDVPHMRLLVNKIPQGIDIEALREQVERAYLTPVTAMLPHADEMMLLASKSIFALQFPHHPVTLLLLQTANDLLD